jgi:hypothetical protein
LEGKLLIASNLWRITKDEYDKKVKEIKERQYDINLQIEDHTRADESYYLTASTILNLAKGAFDIFESSEPTEKRALLNYLLQNPEVEGKKLTFSLRFPFNYMVDFSKQPTWLAWQDSFRTYDWIEAVGDLETTTKEIAHLLLLV